MARGKRTISIENEENIINKKPKTNINTVDDNTKEDLPAEPKKNIEKLIYGPFEIDSWYYSPYPSELGTSIEKLYVCEYCLRYMNKEIQLAEHKGQCTIKKPPGKLIYTDKKIKVYEIDGHENKLYCQNLCLVAKLFLDNKTLYYDTDGFKFYVLTEPNSINKSIDTMVGYFSKEKISYDNYNLACIMILPSHQRKGYGRFLIELSYEISKHEGKIGSPEKPLSYLGSLGYHSYWSSAIFTVLLDFRGQVSIEEISKVTCIHEEDIIDTLSRHDLLGYRKFINGTQAVCFTAKMMRDIIQRDNIKLGSRLDSKNIRWK